MRQIFGLAAFMFGLGTLAGAAQDRKEAVVFDIDGTLTPNVYSIDTARDGGALAANAFSDAGFEVIYVTARIPLFQSGVADWLDQNGFPDGPLFLTETERDRDDHEAFKLRVLQSLAADDWTFVAAFGDSSSDFAAYAQAGIATDRIFALRRRGSRDCKDGVWQGCYAGWADLAPVIAPLMAQ